MVDRQLRRRDIGDERVLAAMERVPRELFLPEGQRGRAYDDAAVPIGGGQTMSQPYIVAKMSELLSLDGDERVLDVGTGSGYHAAVLAELADEVRVDRAGARARRARPREPGLRRLRDASTSGSATGRSGFPSGRRSTRSPSQPRRPTCPTRSTSSSGSAAASSCRSAAG